MGQILAVGIGGFLGANARYLMSNWINEVVPAHIAWGGLPLGTMTVNVLGSFLLAVFSTWAADLVDLSDEVRLLVATGFFGAFTTFSTYANESIALMRDGNWNAGILSIVLTNGLCLLGVVFGLWMMEQLS